MKLIVERNDEAFQGIDVHMESEDGKEIADIVDIRLDITMEDGPKLTVTRYLREAEISIPDTNCRDVVICPGCRKTLGRQGEWETEDEK